MKKTLVFLLTLALAVTASAMVISAASPAVSPEREGIIGSAATAVDGNGDSYNITVITPSDVDESDFEDALEDLQETEKNDNLNIVDIAEVIITGTGDPSFPITVSFNVSGISSSDHNYILFRKSDGSIITIKPSSLANGVMKAEFPELGAFALVSDKGAAAKPGESKPGATSPKTGAQTAGVALLAMISALAIGYSAKKIFE